MDYYEGSVAYTSMISTQIIPINEPTTCNQLFQNITVETFYVMGLGWSCQYTSEGTFVPNYVVRPNDYYTVYTSYPYEDHTSYIPYHPPPPIPPPPLMLPFSTFLATISIVGYGINCYSFLDVNDNYLFNDGELNVTNPSSASITISYQFAGTLVVMPSDNTHTCTDSLIEKPLPVPMLTRIDASMVTPLTTVALFLNEEYDEDASNTLLWNTLSIQNENVWTFDAFYTVLTSILPPWEMILWVVRQSQVMKTVNCTQTVLSANDSCGDCVPLESYKTLAHMVGNGVLNMSNAGNVTAIIHDTAEALGVTYNTTQSDVVAAGCAAENYVFEQEMYASFFP